MRRVLAAIVALSMVATGFAVWAVRTGRIDSSADTSIGAMSTENGPSQVPERRLVVACIPEAEPACAAIETLPGVGFSIEPTEITEGQLGNRADAAPDGWLTTSLSAERVRLVNTTLRAPVAVASTKLVAVTRTGDSSPAAACKGNLSCLATAPKVSFPPVASIGVGLSAATAAALSSLAPGSAIPATLDELDPTGSVVAGLRKATRPTSTDPLTALTSVRLLDAVVTSEARVRAVQPPNTDVTSTGVTVSIVVLLPTDITDERAARVVDGIQSALLKYGFDAPVSPAVVPDPEIANQLGSQLR